MREWFFRRRLAGYGLAVFASSAALLLWLALVSTVGELPHFITFYPAVMLTAILAGFGPGLLATVVAALLADYWILEPYGSGIAGAADAVGLGLFLAMGVFMSAVAESYRRARQKAAEEEALRRAKEDWEKTFNTVPDLLAILDERHRIVCVNRAMAERLKLAPDQCTGLECHKAVHGTEGPPAFCPHALTCQDGREHVAEVHEPRLGGDFLVSTTPRFDEHGRFVGAVHVARDITERKRAEEALRESQEDLNRAQAVAHTGSWRLDVRRNELLWSDENHRMFGIPQGTPLTYETFLATVHPDDRAFVDRSWQAGLRGEPYDIEHRILVGDCVKWVRERAVLEFDEQGVLRGGFGTTQDITERKRAEEALRESEQRLRGIMEALPQIVWTADAEGAVEWFNQRWYDYTGQEPGLGTGWSWESILHPEDLPCTLQRWEEARRSSTVYENEYRCRRHDGEYRWFLARAWPLRDTSGSVVRWLGTSTDIHDLKQAEEARKEALLARQAEEAQRRASAYNRSLIEASLDPLVTIDADGKITDVNAATEKVTGCSRQELVGTDFSDYFTEPDKARAGYQQVFREGSVQDYALEVRHRDGHHTPVLYNASVYRDAAGQVRGVFAAARDITARKQAEEAVKVERQRLHDLLEMLPVYVVLLTPDYHVPFANRFFRERFGESRGRRCFEYLFGRREPCEVCETYTVLQTKAPHHWEWTGPDNRNYDIYDFPFTDADGSPLIMEMGIDITERKRLETELRRINEELEQRVTARTAELAASNKELEAFAYSVSHDLRAPLRAMDGFSQALLEDYAAKLDREGKSHLQRVRAASQRMADLIDGMLSLSRTTRSEMRRRRVDLSGLAQTIAQDLQRTAPARQVEFVIAPNLVVNGDLNLLRVALENLLGNAWKFTSKHPQARIEVGALQREGETAYFVRDDGAGFDMAYVSNLFGVFRRLHAATDFEGTGVGLATVQRIVQRHDGRVWAEGQIEKGAAFYFTLPPEPRRS